MKIRIIVSPTNIESHFLALLLFDEINHHSGETHEIEIHKYSREKKYMPSGGDCFIVVGVEMHKDHLYAEYASCEIKKNCVVYSYNNTYAYLKEPGSVEKNSQPISYKLSSGPLDLRFVLFSNFDTMPEEVRVLANRVCSYQYLQLLDKSELVHAFVNIKEMKRAFTTLAYNMPFMNTFDPTEEFTNYMEQRATVCEYIERGFSFRFLGTAGNGKKIISVNMPREHTVQAARQLNYAHDRFVMFEDLSDCRLWVIVTPTTDESLALAKTLKYHDVWVDGWFVYVITDLPQLN